MTLYVTIKGFRGVAPLSPGDKHRITDERERERRGGWKERERKPAENGGRRERMTLLSLRPRAS